MKKKSVLLVFMMLLMIEMLSGCSQTDALKVKMGFKNDDFEYIKQGKVKKIVIQNKRDKGYKFVVTNSIAISEVYDILSDGKVVNNKSTLDPDYEFDIYEDGNKVQKFNYIVGLDTKDGGNLYSSSKCYIVPNRIDTDIIKNFDDVRTPKDFNKLYYPLISQCITKYRSDVKSSDKEIGINMNDDLEVAKYIFSSDLDDFENSLPSKCKILNKDTDTVDITETITTDGYKYGSFQYNGKSQTGYIYKCTIVFHDNSKNTDKKYSVIGTYKTDDTNWNIDISSK